MQTRNLKLVLPTFEEVHASIPESNASGRVLTKCGFRRIGEVIDPEDGLVWRWEKEG